MSRLTVFDLDGVISRGDTMAVMIRGRLVRNPLRALAAVPLVLLWAAVPSTVPWRRKLSGALAMVAFSGMTEHTYRERATLVGADLGSRPAWVVPEGARLLGLAIASGERVVVSTATEETVARAFLDAAGFEGVTLSATTLRFGPALIRYSDHNWGEAKVRNLGAARPDLFYTDSAADLPVARVSGETVLVNPTAALEARFRSELDRLRTEAWA